MKSGESKRFADVFATVVAAPDQVSTRLEDEVLILSLRSGGYYSLQNVGARIWELVEVPRTIADVRDEIVLQYGAPLDVVEADVLELCQHLVDLGLVDFVE